MTDEAVIHNHKKGLSQPFFVVYTLYLTFNNWPIICPLWLVYFADNTVWLEITYEASSVYQVHSKQVF